MMMHRVMTKRYPKKEEKLQFLEEPATYSISGRELAMASTMSVDEYYDELIHRHQKGYDQEGDVV